MLRRFLPLFAVAYLGSVVSGCGGQDGAAPDGDANAGGESDGAQAEASASDGGLVGDGGVAGDAADAMAVEAAPGDAGYDAGFVTASHPAQPQVVSYGGTVLTSPKVQLIAYAEDPNLGDVEAMISELSKTATWSAQTSEYGVGPLTVLPTIPIQGTPPAMLDDNGTPSPFEQTLVSNITGANPAWGAADPTTIYAFLLPYGTDISSSGDCCSQFYGYHYEAAVTASMSVPYAIICTCDSPAGIALTQLQNVTTTVNHELAESATDPFPNSNPAWVWEDDADTVWGLATGGEVADMCQYNADANYTPPGATYMVQRTWSNMAALAGTNPCVPVPNPALYFDAIPVLPDTVSLGGVTTKGVKIAIGSTAKVDVELFSTAPTSNWKVSAYDLNYYLGNAPNTTVSLSKTSGNNGEVLQLTIHVTSQDPTMGGEGFVLLSDLGGQENISFGAVGN
jgi:hypothetical protein